MIWFQRSTPPPLHLAMTSRWDAPRVAWAALMASSSATYAGAVTGAGGATAICVGPLSTIMRQPPALASTLAGVSGGSVSVGWIDRSHPAANSTAPQATAAERRWRGRMGITASRS
jgi:hypothetical protein